MTQIEFPISIGLIGAPGSGKQKLHEAFEGIAHDYFVKNDSPLGFVENPGNVIENYFDQAMGVFGSPREDLRAFFLRYEEEEGLRRKGQSFISLGTVVDTLAHTGVNLETIMLGVQTPDIQQRLQEQQIAMTQLTFLFLQNFRYTFGFYLPNPERVVIPGADDSEAHYAGRIDAALRTIFANFGIRIQMLDQPTFEEKAQEMFETVKRIVENGPEIPDEIEDPGEDVTEPDEPLSDEVVEALAEDGIELADWEPVVPPASEATVAE